MGDYELVIKELFAKRINDCKEFCLQRVYQRIANKEGKFHMVEYLHILVEQISQGSIFTHSSRAYSLAKDAKNLEQGQFMKNGVSTFTVYLKENAICNEKFG